MNDAYQQHADTKGQWTARHSSNQHTICSLWIWLKKQTKNKFDKSAKTSRTAISHNLLNLEAVKDIQLLHCWSVLGTFLSCFLHIQILV